jgi:hypothetical protein
LGSPLDGRGGLEEGANGFEQEPLEKRREILFPASLHSHQEEGNEDGTGEDNRPTIFHEQAKDHRILRTSGRKTDHRSLKTMTDSQ